MKSLFIVILALAGTSIFAQLPGFEIYLAPLPEENTVPAPVNITNHAGYDNQPSFSPDGTYILYASYHDTIQSDIFKYEIQSKTTKRLTKTRESEYSPTITPDGEHIAVVRVEKDSSQRLCFYNLKGKHAQLMLDSFRLIGYYGWYDSNTIALFNLPEPFDLVITDLQQTDHWQVDRNIGRCLRKIPGKSAISYVVKTNDSIWELRQEFIGNNSTDPAAQQTFLFGGDHLITKYKAGAEDYAWSPDGSKLYMARDAQLLYFAYRGDRQWHLVADYKQFGINSIYRLSISPDGRQVAFVAAE